MHRCYQVLLRLQGSHDIGKVVYQCRSMDGELGQSGGDTHDLYIGHQDWRDRCV
jgi:hypothetical protein